MIYVGIDWSTRHDDVCILDDQGQVIKEFRIDVSAKGFQKLLATVDLSEKNPESISFGIETDKNIIADFLISKGFSVTSINPLSVNRFKERYTTSGKKDDKFDAMNIALILLKDGKSFKPIIHSSESSRELDIHCQTMEKLTARRSQWSNVLNSQLERFYPVFTVFFKDLTSNVALNILLKISRPKIFSELDKNKFLALAAEVKHFGKARKEKMFEYFKENIIQFENPIENAMANRACFIAEEILSINQKISELEKIITEKFEKHIDAPIFKSIQGAGKILAPRLMALMGDNRDRFKSAAQVQSYSGTAPVFQQSGKSLNRVKMRRSCNKRFRNTLQAIAFSSLKQSKWAREIYDSQKKNGKAHSAALRVVANKWAKIVFSMWSKKSNYNSALFEKGREKCAA